MFCNFCGRNFESKEGFEELVKSGEKLIRCEECVHDNREEEYDWQEESQRKGSRGSTRHHP